jgi:hypothetical protein
LRSIARGGRTGTYLGRAVEDLAPRADALEPADDAAAELLNDGRELGEHPEPREAALLDAGLLEVAGREDVVEVDLGAVALEAVDYD